MKRLRAIFFVIIYFVWLGCAILTLLFTVFALLENPVIESSRISCYLLSEFLGFVVTALTLPIWIGKNDIPHINNPFLSSFINLILITCLVYLVDFILLFVLDWKIWADSIIFVFALWAVIFVLVYIVSHNVYVIVKNERINGRKRILKSRIIVTVIGILLLLLFTNIIEKRFFIYIVDEQEEFCLTIWKNPLKSSHNCTIYPGKYFGLISTNENSILLSNTELDFYLLQDTLYIFSHPLYSFPLDSNSKAINRLNVNTNIFFYEYSYKFENEGIIKDSIELNYSKLEEELRRKNTWQGRFNVALNQPTFSH